MEVNSSDNYGQRQRTAVQMTEIQFEWLRKAMGTLRANIDETESAAIITEQGGQEDHGERSQDSSSFCSQFA